MVLTIRVEPLLPKEEQQALGNAAADDGLMKKSQQLLELEEEEVEDTDKATSPVDDFGFHVRHSHASPATAASHHLDDGGEVGVDEAASKAIKQKKDDNARDSAGAKEEGQGLPPVEELEDDWGLEEKGAQGCIEGEVEEEEEEEEEEAEGEGEVGKINNGSK